MEMSKLNIFEWVCGMAAVIFAFGIPGILQSEIIAAVLLILMVDHQLSRRISRLEKMIGGGL